MNKYITISNYLILRFNAWEERINILKAYFFHKLRLRSPRGNLLSPKQCKHFPSYYFCNFQLRSFEQWVDPPPPIPNRTCKPKIDFFTPSLM